MSLSDPPIPGTPEMGCLRPNEANAPVVISFCSSSLFAIDLKTKLDPHETKTVVDSIPLSEKQTHACYEVSANLRGLSLTRLFFAYDKFLSQTIRSIHTWSCRCLHDRSNHSERVIEKKCQLTYEVWAWPNCSLHMTNSCHKQLKHSHLVMPVFAWKSDATTHLLL